MRKVFQQWLIYAREYTWIKLVHESKRAIVYCDGQEAEIIRVTDTYKKQKTKHMNSRNIQTKFFVQGVNVVQDARRRYLFHMKSL